MSGEQMAALIVIGIFVILPFIGNWLDVKSGRH